MSGEQAVIRTDFTRAEAASGLTWLCVGAALSCLLEVVYLNVWLGPVPFPVTIVVAFLFNHVLTTTARLWSSNTLVVLLPLVVWILFFAIFLFGVEVTGDQLLANNIRTVCLLFAGIAGGVWHFVKTK